MSDDTSHSSFTTSDHHLIKKQRTNSFTSEEFEEFDRGSSFLPSVQRWWRYATNPANKHNVMFFLTMTVGTLLLAVKVSVLALLCCLKHEELPPVVAWIVFTGINILLLVLNLSCTLFQRYGKFWNFNFNMNSNQELEDTERLIKKHNDSQPHDGNGKFTIMSRILFVLGITWVSFIMITSVIFLANASSVALAKENYSISTGVVIGFESTACALAVMYFVCEVIYKSMSFAMVAQALTVVVSMLNLLMSILCVWANQSSRLINSDTYIQNPLSDEDLDLVLDHIRAFPYFGVVLATASGVGITAGLCLDATNRLSDPGTSISGIYILFNYCSFIINTVFFGLACRNITLFMHRHLHTRDLMITDPLISFVGMVLNVCGIIAMIKVRQRPNSNLVVEEYDITKLSEGQLEVWARLIDVYNKKGGSNPDAASGDEAISLLKAYVSSPMDRMNCRVLRVYDTRSRAYEKIKAWEKLDQNTALDNDEASLLPEKKEEFIDESSKKNESGGLSKNAAKRARLKAAKKAAKKNGGNPAAVENVNEQLEKSPEEIRRDTQFRNDLIATEALVLLTCIEDYDLVSSLSNTRFGGLLERLVGAKSPWKLSCIRMGLLATHWPFRQCMLFTAPTRKPNARAAAVCRAIAEYNQKLPSSKRCTMILNPTVAHRGQENSIRPSGWTSVPLPPSHIIDLRPYQGNTLQEYLKKIKYRDQAKNFQKAHGEVIETTDFTSENCAKAIDLWWHIASKRTADGNTSVLANPTIDFLCQLGSTANKKGFRSLLFLKVGEEVIASAVLFRLGDTITSDLQGLNHELARQYNAYFVMMQETIAIALKENLKFVDFGPTTSQPKMAIGCREVNLYGGIYARAPLSWSISMFSGEVHVDE